MTSTRQRAAARRRKLNVMRSAVLLLAIGGVYLARPQAVARVAELPMGVPDESASAGSLAVASPVELPVITESRGSMVREAHAEPRKAPIHTPPPGSAERVAILDAVRSSLGIESIFRVTHLRVTDHWAYVRCTELMRERGELRETDHHVAALLERVEGKGERWRVVERWSRHADSEKAFPGFSERVRERERTEEIPSALFPDLRVSSRN